MENRVNLEGLTAGERPLLVSSSGLTTRRDFAAASMNWAKRLDEATIAQTAIVHLSEARGNFLAMLCAALCLDRSILIPHDGLRFRELVEGRKEFIRVVDRGDEDGPGPELVMGDQLATADPAFKYSPLLVSASEHQQSLTLFTSGSTGMAAPHVKSWGALAQGAEQWRRILSIGSQGASLVSTVPHSHMYGLETSVVLPLQVPNLTLFDGKPFFPQDIQAALWSLDGPRIMFTTPTHLESLMRSSVDLPPLYRIVSATAPLSIEIASRAEELWSASVLDAYGSTETGMIATRRPTQDVQWSLRADVSLTFDKDDQATVHAPFLPEPIKLGDQLVKVDDGFLLGGRSDDIVKVAGKRASLAGLSVALTEIPGVNDGVFFLPENAGSNDIAQQTNGSVVRPTAFVVAPDLDADAIRWALRQKIPDVFVPRRIIMLEALPRNDVGKLQKAAMDDLYRHHFGGRT